MSETSTSRKRKDAPPPPPAATAKKARAKESDTVRHFSDTELSGGTSETVGLDAMPNTEDEWRPVRLDPDFDDRAEEPDSDPNWCFECIYGQSKADAEGQTALTDIRTYINQNYHKVDPKSLCREIQDMYNKNARPYVDGQPAWHCAQIYKHYHVDAPQPVIEHEQMLSDVKRVYNVTRNLMIMHNPITDQYEVNDKHYQRFMQLRRAKREDMKAVQELRNHDVN